MAGRVRTCFLLCGLITAAIIPFPAKGSFVGPYALSNFTLTNTNADGTALSDGLGGLILTGGNNGSDFVGRTDLSIASAGAGEVRFDFSYSALDLPDWDLAGYLISGVFTPIAASNGTVGTVSFPISAGQIFGFRVQTIDNTGEPGILAISNFTAPGVAAIPEPATCGLTFLAGAGIVAARKRRARVKRGSAVS